MNEWVRFKWASRGLLPVVILAFCMVLAAMGGCRSGSESTTGEAGSAAGTEQVLIPFVPPRKPPVAIWVLKPTRTNLGCIKPKKAECYDGHYFGVLKPKPKNLARPYFIEYTIRAPHAGRYVLYAGLNEQKNPWGSPLSFSFDGGKLQPVPRPLSGTPRWGPSGAMSWAPLGEYKLKSNRPYTLRIETSHSRATDDKIVFYANGVMGLDLDRREELDIQSLSVSPRRANAGQTLTVSARLRKPAASASLRLELSWKGETVTDVLVIGRKTEKDETIQVQFPLPPDLPGERYEITARPLPLQTLKGQTKQSIDITSPNAPIVRAKRCPMFDVSLNQADRCLQVNFSKRTSDSLLLGLWYFGADGLLYAALDVPVKPGTKELNVELPKDPRWSVLGGGRIEIFAQGKTAAPREAKVSGASASSLPKPMGHGVYVDKSGNRQHWYVRDDHTLVWNGRPYIPFGGMYCCPVLANYHHDCEKRENAWELHHKSLDQIRAAGFNDMYINMDSYAPRWALQSVVDDLNRRGIQFGHQCNVCTAKYRSVFTVYPVSASTNQGLCRGRVEQTGRLKVKLPKTRITELLIIDVQSSSPVRRVEVDIDPRSQDMPEFIELDLTEDRKTDETSLVLSVPNLPVGDYYVLPRVVKNIRIANVWENQDELLKKLSWVRSIDWGPNFRFFTDPLVGEGGLYNEGDELRIWSEAFNREFVSWLKKRYPSLRKLETAWNLPANSLKSYAQAARLLPLRDRDNPAMADRILWIDPQSLAVISTVNGFGMGWLDYLDAVRDSYAEHRDQVARTLKSWVNVPIIHKRVTPWVVREIINRSPGGFDGIGLELYPAWGSFVSHGLAVGSAEAKLGAQTMWLVGTEMGYAASRNNKGQRGWPSANYVRDFIRTTASFGAKGFMFFGWRLEPYKMWSNMQLHSMSDQLAWLKAARDELLKDWPKPQPLAQSYPEGHAWYWKQGGKPLTRYTAVLDSPPSAIIQSVLLRKDPPLWATSSSIPLPGADPILVNFQDALIVRRYGQQVSKWLKEGRHIIYYGTWPAGAALKGMSEHFTKKIINLDKEGSVIQGLKVLPGDKVLAKDDGVVWAKLSGRLLIVARGPVNPPENEDKVLQFLKPQWLETLLNQ